MESAQSGADHPSQNYFRNTAFDATYDCFGVQRLICVDDLAVLTQERHPVAEPVELPRLGGHDEHPVRREPRVDALLRHSGMIPA